MSWCDEALQSQYEIFDLIGEGSYCRVLRARHRLTGVPVAIKVFDKQDQRFLKSAEEVEILQTIAHPNIVSLFQIFETHKNIYLVLELCHTELLQHISRKGCLHEEEARRIFRQVLDGIRYCHGQGVAHLDLKPDNVMLDGRGNAVIIDFGLATRFSPGQKLTKHCGAIMYMSPEVVRCQPYDGPKKDMWSLGVILYLMVTGNRPFKYRSFWQLRRNIVTGNYTIPGDLAPHLRSLIRQLLSINPNQRPTAMEAMNHPWLQQGQGEAGEAGEPEPLPRELDTDILSVMDFMHFDVGKTIWSIRERKFNHLLATYRLLQYMAKSGPGAMAKDKADGAGRKPCPSLADPLLPRRRHSAPALWLLSAPLPSWELPRHQTFCNASVPDLHPSSLHERTSGRSRPARPGLPSAPGSLHPSPGPQRPGEAGPPSKDTPAWPQESPAEDEPTSCFPGLRRCWRACRARVQRCLRRLWPRRPSQSAGRRTSRVLPWASPGPP